MLNDTENESGTTALIDDIERVSLRILTQTVSYRKETEARKSLLTLETLLRHALRNRRALRERSAPVFIMRQWTLASLKVSLRHIRTALMVPTDDAAQRTIFFRQSEIAALWAHQAIAIIRANTTLKNLHRNIDHFSMRSGSLRKGDIILTYKTIPYLKNDLLSRLISIAANSQITHCLIAAEGHAAAQPKLLCSSAAGNGLHLALPNPEPGEIFHHHAAR